MICYAHHLLKANKCSLEYYSIIIELFQRGGTGEDESLSARMILESNIWMETVLRIYYLRHSFDCFTNFMIFFMVYIGNLALEGLSSNRLNNASVEDLRSSLILCVNGLKSYGKSYHVSKLAYYALSTRTSPSDLQLLQTYSDPEDNAADEQALISQAHGYVYAVPAIVPVINLSTL